MMSDLLRQAGVGLVAFLEREAGHVIVLGGPQQEANLWKKARDC